MIRQGDRVFIRSAHGVCYGDVVKVQHIDELPDVPGAPPAASVRGILAEAGVQIVAAIRYHDGNRQVVFIALRTVEQEWFDLQHQRLTITPAGKRRRKS